MKAKRANSHILYTLIAFSLLNFACGTANNQAIVLPVPPPTAQEHQRLQPSSPQRSPRHSPTPLVTEEQAGVYYETVLTIPVGEAGVAYRGVDTPGMDIKRAGRSVRHERCGGRVSADGLQLGVARVPIAEAYYYVMRNLAAGPDGYVYSLLPRPDAVYIVRLKLFKSIAPLVPNAVAPFVTRSGARP